MINTLQEYITYENIYLVANWGVIPFWLLLIFAPHQILTKILVQSVVAPFLLAISYVFFSYTVYLDGNILETFNLYLGLDELYTVFSNEVFLLLFWLHFLSISLFVGCWINRDSQRHAVPRLFAVLSLLLTYFSGPVGILFYWFIRIFIVKKINFDE